MPVTASKRHMNWTGVTFTPVAGGAATTYTGVTSVAFDSGGSLVKFSGDGDRYETTVVNDMNTPTATVQCADTLACRANPVGTVGTLVATHNDAKNGVLTGAITYTMTCIVATNPITGAHRQFGTGTVTFHGWSPDGVTNPISTTVAA